MIEFRHTGIYVRDLPKLKTFYKKIFGLEDVVHQIEKGSFTDNLLAGKNLIIEVCKMKFDSGVILELIELHGEKDRFEDSPVYRTGKVHIAVTVSSVDDMTKKVKINGGSIVNTPEVSPDGKAKVCFVRDPEGNYIELVEEL